jgi:hypothetical protein
LSPMERAKAVIGGWASEACEQKIGGGVVAECEGSDAELGDGHTAVRCPLSVIGE